MISTAFSERFEECDGPAIDQRIINPFASFSIANDPGEFQDLTVV
jgi:hypothetical protein